MPRIMTYLDNQFPFHSTLTDLIRLERFHTKVLEEERYLNDLMFLAEHIETNLKLIQTCTMEKSENSEKSEAFLPSTFNKKKLSS